MKDMLKKTKLNQCKMVLLAFASVALLTPGGHAATIAPAMNDLILGFRATGVPGQTLNLEVDLGPMSQFYGAAAGQTISLPGLSVQDLSATFGASWYTRTDLFWGAVATTGRAAGTPDSHAPVGTLWATAPDGAAAWNRGNVFAQKNASATIEVMLVAGGLGTLNGVTSTANSVKAAVIDATLAGSWTYQDTKTAGTSFGYFNPTVDGLANPPASGQVVAQLYELQPSSTSGQAGTLLGNLVLTRTGLSFHAAGGGGSTGSLTVTISPAGAVSAGAQWQVDGGALQASGATVSGLSTGSHAVAFSTVSGYTTPVGQSVTINNGATTSASGTYTVIAAQSGSLTVTISPAGAVSAGAHWQVDGGAVQASGATVSGLSTGGHTVAFTTVSGYTTPAGQSVTINNGATTTASGTYTSVISGTAPAIIAAPVVTNSLLVIGNQFVVVAGDATVFNVGAADPVDNSRLQYQWAFGDGVTSDWSAVATATHVFPTNDCGPVTASVTVSNQTTATVTNLPITVACGLTVTKLQATTNFDPKKTNIDTATLTATADLGAGFSVTNKTVIVDIGGAQVSFPLDPKGRSAVATGTCRLAYTKPTSKKAGFWTLTIAWSKGTWGGQWAAVGMDNSTHKSPGVAIVLPVAVAVGDEVFAAESHLHYSATLNRTGTAK